MNNDKKKDIVHFDESKYFKENNIIPDLSFFNNERSIKILVLSIIGTEILNMVFDLDEIYFKDIDTNVIFIISKTKAEDFMDSYLYPDRLVVINEI